MTVYLSGPMSGKPQLNFPAFEDATQRLRAAGYTVVSPHELGSAQPDHNAYLGFLRRDLKAMLDCDAIALMEGWQHSRGAKFELDVARGLEMPIYIYHNGTIS